MSYSFRTRIITTCGFCLLKFDMRKGTHMAKSCRTAHMIIAEEHDDDLECRRFTIKCLRCGTDSDWFPRSKGKGKAELMRLKAKHEAAKTSKRKEMKEIRRNNKAIREALK